MSMFPDCRHDEYYNYDFLDIIDKSFVDGFDFCVEHAAESAFNNAEDYFGFTEKPCVTMIEVSKAVELVKKKVMESIESERDMLITSMIENMDEDEYQKLRNKALSECTSKEYYDTRKYAITGKKVFGSED